MMCVVTCKKVLHTLGSLVHDSANTEIMQSMFDCMWFLKKNTVKHCTTLVRKIT